MVRALAFKQVVQKFAFVGIRYRAPYANGNGYFIGNKGMEAIFPWATGPMMFLGHHADEDMIPARVIENWLVSMRLTEEEKGIFWGVKGREETVSDNAENKK